MPSTALTPSPPIAVLTALAVVGAGCGVRSEAESTNATAPTTSPVRAGPTPSQSVSLDEQVEKEPRMMKIQISIGEQRFTATLSESAAARDLLVQLPVTIEMADHGGVEKTGPLPAPLSLQDQPDGADPDPGDLGYYAPGNDLVLYYGDQSFFPGIVILGQLDGDAAQRISELEGPVTATVEGHDD